MNPVCLSCSFPVLLGFTFGGEFLSTGPCLPPSPSLTKQSFKYLRSRHSQAEPHSLTFGWPLEYKTEASLQIRLWKRIFLKVSGGGRALHISSSGRVEPHLGSGFQLLNKRHFSLWDQTRNLNLIVKLMANPQDNWFF